MPIRPDSLQNAVGQILERSLTVKAGENLLVILDEVSLRMRAEVELESLRLGVIPTVMVCSSTLQRRVVSESRAVNGRVVLPPAIVGAVQHSDAILLATKGDVAMTSFRRAFVHQTRAAASRLATVPGFDSEILRLAIETPFETVADACGRVAWALGEAREMAVRTVEPSGQAHVLRVPLSGWDNEPFVSNGIIEAGSWGNFPPGEAFCCPDLVGLAGTVWINGSLPDVCIVDGRGVRLTFADGRIVAIHDTTGSRYFEQLAAEANQASDPNWNVLAEFGIGLNPAIASLTGNSLFDEKAIGTVHFGLGDNSGFGRQVEAHTHVDIVARGAQVEIDGIVLIDVDGLRPSAFDELMNRRRRLSEELSPSDMVLIHKRRIVQKADSWYRKLESGYRTGEVLIPDTIDSAMLEQLVDAIPTQKPIAVSDVLTLLSATGSRKEEIRRLLNLLYHYRVVVRV